MKKLLLGAAAAVAIAAPATAFADTTGYIEGGYEFSDYDSGSDFDALHLGGGVAQDFGAWGIQFDARAVNQEWDGSGDYSHGYAAVHAFTSGGSWDFGGYIGLLDYYGDSGKMIGAETRTAFGNFSLNGSLGYIDVEDFGSDYTALDARVNGAYFFTPNFALTGGLGHTDWDTWTDSEAFDISVGATYQLANGFAISGEYINTDGDNSFGGWEVDSFRIGLRYNFGGGDLQTNTNDGAWTGASDIANAMMRW